MTETEDEISGFVLLANGLLFVAENFVKVHWGVAYVWTATNCLVSMLSNNSKSFLSRVISSFVHFSSNQHRSSKIQSSSRFCGQNKSLLLRPADIPPLLTPASSKLSNLSSNPFSLWSWVQQLQKLLISPAIYSLFFAISPGFWQTQMALQLAEQSRVEESRRWEKNKLSPTTTPHQAPLCNELNLVNRLIGL